MSKKVYEDEELLVFYDIYFWVFVYVFIIFKCYIVFMVDVIEVEVVLFGCMMVLGLWLMKELGVINGFCYVINIGFDGG